VSVPNLLNFPFLIFLVSILVMWGAAVLGRKVAGAREMPSELRSDFSTIVAATLTLLGLIIGFSFSMATARYDLRKTYEEAEANAIGTEYVRADLLPEPSASQVRALLRHYTMLRIQFYNTRWRSDLVPINAETEQVQNQLWNAVTGPASVQPTPVIALTVAGMNDVLNAQGYTQAAWWNRIPLGAWCLMFAIAIICNGLLGYGAHQIARRLLVLLPIVVSVSFFLIADIDSPRGGVIRVRPQNLQALVESIHAE
jgi:hypothetical protein